MFVVCINTFEWSSLRRLKRMPTADAVIMVAVTLVTIFTDLAVAVICGVVISALVFAWQHARISVVEQVQTQEQTTYRLEGPLFLAPPQLFRSYSIHKTIRITW